MYQSGGGVEYELQGRRNWDAESPASAALARAAHSDMSSSSWQMVPPTHGRTSEDLCL